MKGYFKLHLYSPYKVLHILDRTPNIMHIYIILYYIIIFAKNLSKSLCSLKRLIDLYGFLHFALIYFLRFNFTWKLQSVHVWRLWLKLLVENSQSAKEIPITIMRIIAYSRSYPMTVQGPVPYPLCPVPSYDVGKVHKLESLELYDYLTLFQYPWNLLSNSIY